MSRSKTKEVQKFGGVSEARGIVEHDAKDAPVKDVNWQAQELEVKSETHLEDDEGHGESAIVRMFEFAMNPQAFHEAKPTKQDLFNYHHKGIEIALWKDGMKVIPEVNPKIVIDEKKMKYMIFVGAKPMRGHILKEQPKTLAQHVHGV